MLPEAVLTQMAQTAATKILTEGAARATREELANTIRRALAEEMDVERALYDEADKIIKANLRTVKTEGANVADLREKILAKLARDKGVVLK